MPKKRLTTNGNVFKRTDGRWQSNLGSVWIFWPHWWGKRKTLESLFSQW